MKDRDLLAAARTTRRSSLQSLLAFFVLFHPVMAPAARHDRIAKVNFSWALNPASENVSYYTLYRYEQRTPGTIIASQSITPPLTIGLPQNGYWHIYLTAFNGQESPHSSPEIVWHNGGYIE